MGLVEKYGNIAIHKYAYNRGWKDGSEEKNLLHGALGFVLGNANLRYEEKWIR